MNAQSHKLITYTAFSKHKQGGNPAGVVPDSDGLTPCQMQDIAQKAGYSETVFIRTSQKADYCFRYFTPVLEVPACGHATLAGLTYLKNTGLLKTSTGNLDTPGGVIHFRIHRKTGHIYIQQAKPEFGSIVEPDSIADSLGISQEDLTPDLPIQCVSTGLWDILIPVKSKNILMGLQPDMDRIERISRDYQATGYHVFAPGDEKYTAYCRNFAPAAGIPEEAATGTASGALYAYLNNYLSTIPKRCIFSQGSNLNRPSEIYVFSESTNSDSPALWIGGHALPVETHIIHINNHKKFDFK